MKSIVSSGADRRPAIERVAGAAAVQCPAPHDQRGAPGSRASTLTTRLPQLARAMINSPDPPAGQTVEDTQKQLEKVFVDPKLVVTATARYTGSGSTDDQPASSLILIEQLTPKFWPGVLAWPTMSAWRDRRPVALRNVRDPDRPATRGLASRHLHRPRGGVRTSGSASARCIEGEQHLYELVKLLSGG